MKQIMHAGVLDIAHKHTRNNNSGIGSEF